MVKVKKSFGNVKCDPMYTHLKYICTKVKYARVRQVIFTSSFSNRSALSETRGYRDSDVSGAILFEYKRFLIPISFYFGLDSNLPTAPCCVITIISDTQDRHRSLLASATTAYIDKHKWNHLLSAVNQINPSSIGNRTELQLKSLVLKRITNSLYVT
ncbi:unnamed protein product [Allacma fusca]|uniref:Uncharacterized protein n=1 Tax=Allacma fusca TaxID=39272 RepID=A0A8J2LCM7_9HEXA|nr:unnamed protein product [Allacma fusca]